MQMQAQAQKPRSSRTANLKAERDDRIRHHSCIHTAAAAQHSVPFSRLPTSASAHPSLDLGHSRFKRTCLTVRSCQQTHICAKALLLYLHRRRSLQSGVHVCARVRRPSSMGFNALADLAATCVHACVRAGCGGRSGGSCWAALHARRYALHAMQVGWLGDGRLARLVGRIGR